MIPFLCKVRVVRPDGRRRRIWLPLFLLWPFILALFVVLELLVILASVALLFIRPRDALKVALALPPVLCLLLQSGGSPVEFAERGRYQVLVELS